MPTKTYKPIATTTLASAANSYTFTSIPSIYTDLVLVITATSSTDANIYLRVGNGSIDSGNNYSFTLLVGDGTTATSGRGTNATVMIGTNTGSDLNNKWCMTVAHFMNYANTTTYKTVINRTSGGASETVANVGLWRNTSAINQIQVTTAGPNYSAGSTFTLYGIE